MSGEPTSGQATSGPAATDAASLELSPEDHRLLQDTATRIVAARMSLPAMIFLETVSPMNYVSSVMLRVMSPAWRTIVPQSDDVIDFGVIANGRLFVAFLHNAHHLLRAYDLEGKLLHDHPSALP